MPENTTQGRTETILEIIAEELFLARLISERMGYQQIMTEKKTSKEIRKADEVHLEVRKKREKKVSDRIHDLRSKAGGFSSYPLP